MNPEIWIPPRTREKLANPAPVGQRHKQMIDIAMSLLGQGLHPLAVITQLRTMFPREGPDLVSLDEIKKIVHGCHAYDPRPCVPNRPASTPSKVLPCHPKVPPKIPTDAVASVEHFLAGFRCSLGDIGKLSPVPIQDAPAAQAIQLLEAAFRPQELVNLVATFKINDSGKPYPTGYGKTDPRTDWVEFGFRHSQPGTLDLTVPQGEAGTWIRINPLDGNGIADRNVSAFRHLLLEFDDLPTEPLIDVEGWHPKEVRAGSQVAWKADHDEWFDHQTLPREENRFPAYAVCGISGVIPHPVLCRIGLGIAFETGHLKHCCCGIKR